MSSGPSRVYWIVMVVLLLLTRIPAAAQYLSIDNVNLAFALDNFDPRLHQPQPPGYPFFVGFAKFLNFFIRDPEWTFLVISVLVTGLCLPLTVSLGTRMFGQWAGQAAALLLLLNPVFWQSGLDGPLRPFLAFFSLSTAYCAWRAWHGETAYVFWGAVAVGAGSGFRPDLLAYLGPIWLVSAWMGTRSIKVVVQGGLVFSAVVLIWVGSLVYAVEGVDQLYTLTMDYLIEQSRTESVLLGAADNASLRQLSRLVVWNGLAIIGWIWAVPFFLRRDPWGTLWNRETAFMLVWLVPGLIFQALVHVAAPGHTLFSIPAWCVFGGHILRTVGESWNPPESNSIRVREVALAGAVALNVMLFLNYFPTPATNITGGIYRTLRNVAVFATFETSISQVRWLDEVSRLTLEDLAAFTPADRPMVIVSNDVHYQQWFMNWRIARYYAPNTDIWVTDFQQRTPEMARLIRRDKYLDTVSGDVISIPVPAGGRILWLLEHDNPFHKAMTALPNLHAGQRLFYTDIPEGTAPFTVLNYQFVPTHMDVIESSRNGVQ